MQEGFVSVSHGLHWRRHVDGPNRDFAQSIPGTHAVMRTNDLPAWRCHACQLLLLKYGLDVRKASARPTIHTDER
jgi:hypothetical protein